MKKTLLAIAAAVLVGTMPAAQAQWVVIDPTNLVQNIMTAARALEQINNQIKQLQNEAQMLMNDAKNLTSLDFSALNQLRAAMSATNQLLQQAQGLAFNLSQMETEFARSIPMPIPPPPRVVRCQPTPARAGAIRWKRCAPRPRCSRRLYRTSHPTSRP
jgi:P-type conjugative transfer protein TrbJ